MAPEVRVVSDPAALAKEGAELFVQTAREAIASRGRCSVALAGGSTPKAMYHLLASHHRNDLRWDAVHLFFGDERFVPYDDSDSTVRLVRETLLAGEGLSAHLHPMPTTGNPDDAAAAYARELEQFFSSSGAFDLVLLGMGPDGHTASLFPNHPSSTAATKNAVISVFDAPKPPPTRLSLSFDRLNAARLVVFLIGGADKAPTVKRILEDGEQLPAARVQPPTGRLLWLLDAAAARDLKTA